MRTNDLNGLLQSSRSKATLSLAALALSLCFVGLCHAEVKLRDGTVARFASISEGRQILTRRDDFIQRLSAFDRSARRKTDKPTSEKEFLEFVKANVVAWTDEEKRTIGSAIEHVRPRLEALSLSLPRVIYFVKTTGGEEGRAAYTRDTAIVLPKDEIAGAVLEKTICHELFHILSRENPELREKLYEMIGFTKCAEIEFPRELKSRKITNPDAPRNDHFIRLQVAGSQSLAVPILFASAEKYDVPRGGEFFNYLQFQFLLVKKNSDSSVKFLTEGSHPKLVSPQQVSGFSEQIGRNTNYVIHPEEILADNFALLVIGAGNVASPEILQKMKEILTKK